MISNVSYHGQDLHIEEEIARSYPELAAFYKDDQTWLKRKQEKENKAEP